MAMARARRRLRAAARSCFRRRSSYIPGQQGRDAEKHDYLIVAGASGVQVFDRLESPRQPECLPLPRSIVTNRSRRPGHPNAREISSITCFECLFELSDYLDQTASPDLLRSLEMHLGACRACFVMMDSTREIIRLFRETPPPQLPEEIHARLMNVIAHRILSGGPI